MIFCSTAACLGEKALPHAETDRLGVASCQGARAASVLMAGFGSAPSTGPREPGVAKCGKMV